MSNRGCLNQTCVAEKIRVSKDERLLTRSGHGEFELPETRPGHHPSALEATR